MKNTTEATVRDMMANLKQVETNTINAIRDAFVQAITQLGRNPNDYAEYIDRETGMWLRRMSDSMCTQHDFKITMAQWEQDDKASND